MSRLNTIIDANIKENGNQEITGKALNYVLNEIAKEVEQGGNVKADGVYPDLIAGDLAGRGESVPAEFTFRASGGKSIKDGKAYIKRIKGNSVVWNQLISKKVCEFTLGQGITGGLVDGKIVLNGTAVGDNYIRIVPYGSFVYRANHKYALIKEGSEVVGAEIRDVNAFIPENTIGSVSSDIDSNISVVVSDGVTITDYHINSIRVVDLTKMFGAGNEPSTIEEYEARKPIVADEYAFNEGEVIHMNTDSIKSVGDNAWDEQWENGTFNTTTGELLDGEYEKTQIRCKNPIKILPNERYHFTRKSSGEMWIIFFDNKGNVIENPTHDGGRSGNSINVDAGYYPYFITPSNADTMRFYMTANYGSTYNNDIMITLVHSGWKQDTDAGYQPYWQDTLPLPVIRKYFPDGMKSAGSAHDEIRFNKTTKKWEKVQRIGSVDLGTLDWWHNNEGRMIAALAYGVFNKVLDNEPANAICAQYPIKKYVHVYTNNYGLALSYQEPYLYVTVFDSAYTDAATFKAAMQGVILYYELAEPIVTEITDSFRDYYNVADFGTEQAISNILSAPFSADIIYQFNAVDMIRENYNEIERIKAALAKVGITLD